MTDSIHGGRLVAAQLAAEGVDTVFTLSGGHISAIYDGIVQQGGIRVVDVRHEQAAAHAADAYARLNRAPAVAVVTAGPGVTGAITGFANAAYANSPLVLLGGANPLALHGMGALQDAPHCELLRPVAKSVERVVDPFAMREVLERAFTTAQAPTPGPVYVDIPMDLQLSAMDPADVRVPRQRRFTHRSAPDPDAVTRTAAMLAHARTPVIFCGSGCYWDKAEAELDLLSRVLRAPVFVNGMARGMLPRAHPYFFQRSRRAAMANADLLLVLGAEFDFRLGYGRGSRFQDDVQVIQVASQAEKIGRNRAVDLGVLSDIRAFLSELLKLEGRFGRSSDSDWIGQVRDVEQSRRRAVQAELEAASTPIHPMRLIGELEKFIERDTVVVGDGGDILARAGAELQVDRPGHWLDPGPFGCLGVGVPFALAARLARPDAPVLGLFGDGAFGFNAFEYDSAVRQNLPFVGVIGNDGAWGEMKVFHKHLFGPDHLVAQDLSQATKYEQVVEGLGGYGERVERPEQIAPALERAQRAGVPAVLNVILDPSIERAMGTISEAF